MKHRKLGTTDIEISVISLGTWAIGGGRWWGDTDKREAIEAIHAGLDAGINCVDTAPAYGFGRSEEIVGKALAGRRSNVVLSTKCGLWWKDSRGSFRLLESWKDLTESYGCSMAQLVIAWTIAQEGITTALCGARKKHHVVDNVGAGAIELEQADIDRMRKDMEALGGPG